jgi:Outer membrane protein beta-barrel domain
MRRESILKPEKANAVTKVIKKLFVFSLLFAATAAYSQVAQSATGGESVLWVGGEYSNFNPDYGPARLNGLGATFDLNVTPKIGVIGEARWLHFGNSADGGETQSDYLAGAKYRLYKWNKFDFDAKFLVGGVWIRFPGSIGSGSYFALAPGAFADYRLTSRFRVRGGYEFQFLPSAPNIPGQPSNGLTPRGFTIGLEYAVIR